MEQLRGDSRWLSGLRGGAPGRDSSAGQSTEAREASALRSQNGTREAEIPVRRATVFRA